MAEGELGTWLALLIDRHHHGDHRGDRDDDHHGDGDDDCDDDYGEYGDDHDFVQQLIWKVALSKIFVFNIVSVFPYDNFLW